MDELTLKNRINDALKATGYRYFYLTGDTDSFPFIRFSLGNHIYRSLSSKYHHSYIWYQVDVFSEVPKNVENDPMLFNIKQALLDEGLKSTAWKEAPDLENNTQFTVYHYYCEVKASNLVQM